MSWSTKIIRWSFYSIFFFVPLILTPFTSELFEFPKMLTVYLFTTIIATAWVCQIILEKKVIFKKSILDFPILLFLASNFLSFLASISPHVSWYGYYSRFNGGMLSLICYAILYWAFVTFMDKKSTLLTIRYTLISSLLVCLWGIAEHFGIDADKWVQDVQNRIFSTLGQPNWLSAYLVAIIFLPLSSKKLNAINYTLYAMLFITLLFTKSRSGLLAFGISSIIFWALEIRTIRSIRNFLIFSGIAIPLIIFTTNPISEKLFKLTTPPPPPGKTTAAALDDIKVTESGDIRKIVWTGATRIWLDGPKNILLGTGPETFAMSYFMHRPTEHNQTSEWELLYNKAHNEYLNYLANTGLFGLISYTILLITMTYQLFKAKNPALLAGWISISITNFWGFSVVIMQIFLFLFPAMSTTLSQESESHPHPQITKFQMLLLLIPIFSSFYILFSIFRYLSADVAYANGQYNLQAFTATQDTSYLLKSYDQFLLAYQNNSQEPAIASEFSTISSYISLALPSESTEQIKALTDSAIQASDLAIKINPYHVNYYKARARMFIVLATLDPKYYALADEAVLSGIRVSPTDPRLPYLRGQIALYRHEPDLAQKYFDQAGNLHERFAIDGKRELEEYLSKSN